MRSTMTHRHKRPFQPQITSYFAREDRDDSDAGALAHAREQAARNPLQGPRLESQVQASLLSVGMRIRKAVPEGYKTHKTALFEDTTPARSYTGVVQSAYARPRELLPYCGLLDVGGLRQGAGAAAVPVNALGGIDVYDEEDEGAFAMSSQESGVSSLSTDSAPARGMGASPPVYNWHKRRFEDEENEDVFALGRPLEREFADIPSFQFELDSVAAVGALDAASSSSSSRRAFPVSHTSMPDLGRLSDARPMAVPRSRRRGAQAVVGAAPALQGDFEEAEFLVPWDDVDMDGV